MTENDAENPLQIAHESLRDFLDRRERELEREIAALHSQLVPKEAELAEVRRAKVSLGIATATQHHLAADGLSGDGPSLASPKLTVSAYQALTMKELVVKALREHFHNGATTRQLREFFRDGWGREIGRANLSPQLSRLRRDGLINWQHGVWSLVEKEPLK